MSDPVDDPGKPSKERPDPVPESVLKRAREAFSQGAGGPVARLVTDSLIEEIDPPSSHRLVFEMTGVRIELRVAVSGSESILEGNVEGTAASKVMVQLEGTDLAWVVPVEDGSFGFEPMSHGIVRLVFAAVEGSTIFTDWFQI